MKAAWIDYFNRVVIMVISEVKCFLLRKDRIKHHMVTMSFLGMILTNPRYRLLR